MVKKCTVLLLLISVLFFSCASSKEVYEPKNYSDQAIRELEIARIQNTADDNSVMSLWQISLIKEMFPEDEAVKKAFTEVEKTVFEQMNSAVENKKLVEATRLFNSLTVLNSSLVTAEDDPSQKLSSFTYSVATNPDNTKDTIAHVSQMILGTVTVWVDKGIKVEAGRGYVDTVLGSGFFIDSRGYIVTNHHVIESEVDPEYEGFSRLYIRLAEDPETRIPAKVIGWDKALDLALLKAEIPAPYVFDLGSSSSLNIGDRIFAIGSPIGLDKTLTGGIISATERELLSLANVMQIDAAINVGNSGGPIIDTNGTVLGVAFAGIKPYEGLNFAIPVEYLKLELDALQEGGEIEHGWIGVHGRTKKDVGPNALQEGIEVLYRMPGGPAYLAGIQDGDVITAINGKTVSTIEELKYATLGLRAETIITLSGATSDGNSFSKIVCLTKRPESPGLEIFNRDLLANAMLPIFGMKLTSTSDFSAKKYYINSIERSSIADESGFSELDPIEINRTRFSPDNDAIQIEVFTKKRRNGYLEVFLSLVAPLDSPSYF